MEGENSALFSRRDLKRLILPLVVEQFLAVTIGMMDTIMVSSCGEAAVSGVSLVDSINILMINIFSALATGGSIIADAFGGGSGLGGSSFGDPFQRASSSAHIWGCGG